MPKEPKEKKALRFCLVSVKEASGQPSADLKALNKSSTIYINKLALTEAQATAIDELYANGQHDDIEFSPDNPEDQSKAMLLLAELDIDITAKRTYDPANRWSVKWTSQTNSTTSKNRRKTRRTLFQCNSGFTPSAFSSKAIREQRRFTSCLSHVEITYSLDTFHILRFRGYFGHNAECMNTYNAIRATAAANSKPWEAKKEELTPPSGATASAG